MPPPPKFVHLLCGMELRRRLVLLLQVSLALSIALRFETHLHLCGLCRSVHAHQSIFRGSGGDRSSLTPLLPCVRYIRLFFYVHLLFVAPSEHAISIVVSAGSSSAPLTAIGTVFQYGMAFAHLYSLSLSHQSAIFFSVITVNNVVVGDRRYHRCNALLMVSDSCGRSVCRV